jgi:HSP90 family molecular chaperone
VTNRNITLSLPESLVKKARILAAESDQSVSALVAELIAHADRDDEAYHEAWRAEMEVMKRGLFTNGPISWTRDEVHDR